MTANNQPAGAAGRPCRSGRRASPVDDPSANRGRNRPEDPGARRDRTSHGGPSEFAALPAADPLRGVVLREELILAFLPVVEHLARRHAHYVTASVEELMQVGTVALMTAIDRWDPALARGEF